MAPDRPRVLVLHNVPRPAAPGGAGWAESDAGVLVEAEAVARALEGLGLAHRTAAVGTLADAAALLAAAPEEVVFNLVEGFLDRPADAAGVPLLCHALGKGFTGADAPCLWLALDKGRAKAVLEAAGVPCPPGVEVPVGGRVRASGLPPGPYIVKPARADASEGIDADSLVPRAGSALARAVQRVHREFGQAALVEQFIDGRELNVSVVERGGSVEVLPLAEIDFSAFGGGRPRLVDYGAKWHPESFAYQNTPLILPARLPAGLAREVRRLARAAWDALGCSGYARVDFRLDAGGRPYVLEVNPNPDVSSDAGFAAALEAAGIPFATFVGEAVRGAATGAAAAPRRAGWTRRAGGGERTRRAGRAAGVPVRRSEPRDREAVLALLRDTGFFREDEMAVAAEVLDEALAKGPGGHYQSFVADERGEAAGWVCFGPTPCTVGTFDVYWIGVAPGRQGRGLGAALMAYAEGRIRERGGRMAVVETSGRAVYEPTRAFYRRLGYREAGRIPDFYAPGDDKVVYAKDL